MKWPKSFSAVSKSKSSTASSRRSSFRSRASSIAFSSRSSSPSSSSSCSPSRRSQRSGLPENKNKEDQYQHNRISGASLEFSMTGKVLTQEEKIQRAKLKGYCIKCGMITHKKMGRNSISKRPITSPNVYHGICIKCNPTKVPNAIRFQYFNTHINSDRLAPGNEHTIHHQPQHHQSEVSSSDNNNNNNNNNMGSNKLKRAAKKISAATAFVQSGTRHYLHKNKVYVPKSAHQKVLDSMKYIQDDLKGAGMDFFVGVFKKYPQVKKFFPFAFDIDRDGISVEEIRDCKKLQIHSYLVMKTLASIVGGLSEFQSLIPYLRELGRRHIVYGILPIHYDLIVETLIETIRRRVTIATAHMSNGTLTTQGCWTEETKQAWEVCYNAIKSVMADPSKHLECEIPNIGWGLYHTLACCYLCLVTPYRLAMIVNNNVTTISSKTISISTTILSFVAISIIAIDMICEKLKEIVFHYQNETASKSGGKTTTASSSSPDLSSSSAAPSEKDDNNNNDGIAITADGNNNIVSKYIDLSRRWLMKMKSEAIAMLHKHEHNNKWLFAMELNIKRLFRRMEVNRWEYWVHIDTMILTSYVFEYMLLSRINNWISYYFPQTYTILLCCIAIFQCSGLIRVIHFWYRIEMMALQNTSSITTTTNFFVVVMGYKHLLFIRLILLFMYTIHIFGCAYLMVYHINEQQQQEGNNLTFVYYFRAIYWAFVSITGIGQYNDSEAPTAPLEISFSLLTHVVGLVFYFVLAGQCFTFAKNRSHSADEIEDGIRSLTSFMDECDIPKLEQDKFLSSYIMQHFLTNKSSSTSSSRRRDNITSSNNNNINNSNPLDIQQQRSIPDVVSQLPGHLGMELTLFSRAKELRTRGLPNASEDFALGLVSMLNQNVSLLAGDYLIRAGQKIKQPGKVWMVDRGVLEVFVDGISKGCLYPGDILGKGWLSTQPMEAKETVQYKSYMDWRSPQGDVAIADIRCMSHCRLIMGIGGMSEISYLRRTYPVEMQQLTEDFTPVTLQQQPNGNKKTNGTTKRISVPSAPITVPIDVPLNDVDIPLNDIVVPLND